MIDFRTSSFRVFNINGESSEYSGQLIKNWPSCGQLLPMVEISRRYALDYCTSEMLKYSTGMRPDAELFRSGTPIQFAFELTPFVYGNANTLKVAHDVIDRMIFRRF
jgi:hypothetical protein